MASQRHKQVNATETQPVLEANAYLTESVGKKIEVILREAGMKEWAVRMEVRVREV